MKEKNLIKKKKRNIQQEAPIFNRNLHAHLIENDLRCYIFWCTTKRPRLATKTNLLSKPKIDLYKNIDQRKIRLNALYLLTLIARKLTHQLTVALSI